MSWLSLLQPAGIDVFCVNKKYLVYNLVDRNLKVKYRRSIFGIFWTLLSPLSLAAIYYFVFKVVLSIPAPNYLAYLISGILPWAFFSQTVMEGLDSITGSSNLISKIPVPIQVFPLVGMMTNFITLVFALPVMVLISIISGVSLGPSLILLPLLFGFIGISAYAVGLLAGLLSVFFHDLKHVTGLLIQIWFYATPVLYHSDSIPAMYKWILLANPVAPNFIAIHAILSDGAWPDVSLMVVGAAWSAVLLAGAIAVLKSCRSTVAENL